MIRSTARLKPLQHHHPRPVRAENPVTSRDLHILVYEATESISSQRPKNRCGRRGSVGSGRVLTKCAVRAVRVVVLDVLAQHYREVALSADQEEVEAFAPQGANEAFRDRVRTRCSYRGCG